MTVITKKFLLSNLFLSKKFAKSITSLKFTILKEIDSKEGGTYGYMTLHRAENTDEKFISLKHGGTTSENFESTPTHYSTKQKREEHQ